MRRRLGRRGSLLAAAGAVAVAVVSGTAVDLVCDGYKLWLEGTFTALGVQ